MMSLLGNLIGRASGRGCDSWSAGDLGECICADWFEDHSDHPRVGDLIKVTEVVRWRRLIGLCLAGKDSASAWDARAFRKIVVCHEPASVEFAATLRPKVDA